MVDKLIKHHITSNILHQITSTNYIRMMSNDVAVALTVATLWRFHKLSWKLLVPLPR